MSTAPPQPIAEGGGAPSRSGLPRPRVSVIIPTMNRPVELLDCVRTLACQTWMPDELIIVDNAELDDAPIRRIAVEAGMRYVFLRIARPGIARSRNLGIDHSSGEIIMFLDDDCLLHSEYVEEVMDVFVEDAAHEVGGASGMERLIRPWSLSHRVWDALAIFFCQAGTRRQEGRMLSSGFMTEMLHFEKRTNVEYLHGCFTTWRRAVFDEDRFDEFFDGYGTGEDKEFSYRVGRKHRLVINPRGKIHHLATSSGRANFIDRGFQGPYNNNYIFKKLMPQTVVARLMFAWAVIGMMVQNALWLPLQPTKQRMDTLLGVLKGISHLLWARPFRHLENLASVGDSDRVTRTARPEAAPAVPRVEPVPARPATRRTGKTGTAA